MDNPSSEIEFNSMVAILKRLDRITYEINEARANKDYETMIGMIYDYFKEISPDLTPDEMEIQSEIEILRRFVSPLMPDKINYVVRNADNVDIKLRKLAKKHGYLTKNIKDVRKAILDM